MSDEAIINVCVLVILLVVILVPIIAAKGAV